MPVRVWPRAPVNEDQFQSVKINYRPEIDGLRSIAVVSVILYHAQIVIFNFQPFKGGFIGVDIFFVISGYLITSIIIRELNDKGSLSFKNFYLRRARRILPALLFVILASIPFSWVYLYPIDLFNYSKSILYSVGFASNFFFHFSGLEYGSPEGLLKPFLHTWSLAVEEQYYIIFPIVLVFTYKYFRKYLIHTLSISLIVSLFLGEWGSRNYPSSTFYLLHARVWELVFGSLVAYFEIKLGHRCEKKFLCQVFSSMGLFLIICSILFFDNKIFHPSFYTLFPVIGVTLILWFSNKEDIITRILSHSSFVKVGLISYSLYLWHYPIFSFAKNLEIFFNNNIEKLVLIILTFIIATLTYFFVEQPARKFYSLKKFFLILLTSIFIIFIYTVTVIKNDGFVKRLKVKNYQEKHTYSYLTQDGKHCFNRKTDFCNFNSHEKKIILLGDSHMASLAHDLNDRIKDKYSFLPLTMAGYFHLRNIKQINKHTKKINKEYEISRVNIDKILNKLEGNIIIIGGVTSLYFYNKRIEGRAHHWDNMFVDKDTLKYDSELVENAFINLIKELSINNKVIILYPIPEVGVNLQKKKFENMVRVFEYKYSDFLKQNQEVINFFDSINLNNVYKVHTYKAFCKKDLDLCKTHDEHNFFFFDGYHPSLEGAKMINDLIINKIELLERK